MKCQDCKWFRCSSWTKHKTPRISKGARTTCAWPIPPFVVPKSIKVAYGYIQISSGHYAGEGWTGCPTWEAKE